MKNFTLLFLLISCKIFSQKDSLRNQNKKEINIDALPYYNFGKGVGITSPDSLFQMNIRFRMQNRFEMLKNYNQISYEAMIRRLRLRLDGYVGDPRFLYAIQLSFAPRDVGPLEPEGDLNIIRDAMIFFNPNSQWSFGFGQTKLPGNRQRVNSSGALQLTDRSINNGIFNIDRDFGFHAYHLHNKQKNKFGYNIKTSISTGEGRNWTQTKDNGLAYTVRLELYPLGQFKKNGEFFEGDILREQSPKLYLGATYHYNQKARRSAGQLGNLLFEQRDLSAILLDAVLKYKGFAAMASYMNRNTPNAGAITINPNNINEIERVNVGYGYDGQISYTFTKNWEIIGRFSLLHSKKEIFRYLPNQIQYSIGLTKYIWEHAFKAQLELTKNHLNYFDGRKDQNWYIRFQIEMGI